MNRVLPLAVLGTLAGCAVPVLRPTEPVTGQLTTEHRRFADGSYFQEFVLDVKRGDTLTALLTSDDFDPLLVLEDWYGRGLREDDDGGGGCNARLTYVAPRNSLYRLYATSAGPEQVGAFRLQVWYKGSPTPPPPPPSDPLCHEFGSATGVLALGRSVMGGLEAGDAELGDSTYVEHWLLSLVPRTTFTIDVESAEVDPYVALTREGGEALGADDDGGPGCAARLTYTATDARPLRVLVSSSGGRRQTGAYQLRVRRGIVPQDSGRDCLLGVALDAVRITRSITIGDSAGGELTPQDIRLPRDGTHAQWWRLEGAAGDSATIDLVSDAFDAYLVVTGPAIEGGLEDDDSGGACHARVSLRLTERGGYHIIVNSTAVDAAGPFLLRVSPAPPPPIPGACRQN